MNKLNRASLIVRTLASPQVYGYDSWRDALVPPLPVSVDWGIITADTVLRGMPTDERNFKSFKRMIDDMENGAAEEDGRSDATILATTYIAAGAMALFDRARRRPRTRENIPK